MDSTLAELRSQVRSFLNEPTAKYWTDAEIDFWLNRALLDINQELAINKSYYDQNTQAGKQDYLIATDIVHYNYIYAVQWKGWELKPCNMKDTFGPTQIQGTPTNFFIWGANIYLYPIPTEVATLKQWYLKTGAVISGSEKPWVPDYFRFAMVFFAVHLGKFKDSEFAESDAWFKLYQNEINKGRLLVKDSDMAGLPYVRDEVFMDKGGLYDGHVWVP